MRFHLARFFSVLLLSAACGERSHPNGNLVTIVDSAGVRLTTAVAPLHDTLPWRVSDDPSLLIGRADGPVSEFLDGVADARLLPDGRVVVSHAGSSELRLYDPTGVFERTIGRSGSGPGEFGWGSQMRILMHTADSVMVTDEANARLNVFGLDGGAGQTVQPVAPDGAILPTLQGRLADGRWLITPMVAGTVLDGAVGDVIPAEHAVMLFSQGEGRPVELARMPGRTRIVNEGPGMVHYPFVPFSQFPVLAVRDTLVAIPVPDAPALAWYDPQGRVVQQWRWQPTRIRVADIWSRYAADFLTDVSPDRLEAYRNLLARDNLPLPEWVPAVSAIVVDDAGGTWVSRFRLPWEPQATWDVLDRKGRWLGAIPMPPRFTLFAATERQLVGRQLDEDGVEQVAVYRLEKR